VDELNINKETIYQSYMKIYGTRKFSQSSSHIDEQTSRSNGDSHHAKTSSRLVKTIPHFFITFFSFLPYKKKGFQDAEDLKKTMMAELNAVPLAAFADYFQNFLKQFNKCTQVGRNYF
jgi:hypothetical protein